MVFRDLQQILETWAPRELAWEEDNVGAQIGTAGKTVRSILVALDVTDEVVAEAKRKRCDAIVTHHPLFFRPLRSINADRRVERLATELVRNDIALYAAHTNLDFTPRGVSETLAGRLELLDVTVLKPSSRLFKKVAVFVPVPDVERVAAAMAGAGAGAIGNYDSCSFRSAGTGTYRANDEARPYIGRKGVLEHTPEIRLETLVPVWLLDKVIAAMKESHPYEEVAFDVAELANTSGHHGSGAIGTLPTKMTTEQFLKAVKKKLNASTLRYSPARKKRIERVAVCGGSGSELLSDAISSGADAFVTSDVRFHTFQEADGRITLVDAGHYETEQPIVRAIVGYLKGELKKRNFKVPVAASAASRNAVHYFYS
jgi:dinuclear metal center YbgI/SA1388 family protein